MHAATHLVWKRRRAASPYGAAPAVRKNVESAAQRRSAAARRPCVRGRRVAADARRNCAERLESGEVASRGDDETGERTN